VSDVLAAIQPEFPTLSPSKLRFLDTQGLVSPQRTGGGYRHYSPADVERLRFVLRQQRDHYRPLTVIAERLAALDSGEEREGVTPVAVTGEIPAWLDARALSAAAGVSAGTVATLATEGIITEGLAGKFARKEVAVVRAAGEYLEGGGDIRTLRGLRNAAMREASAILAAVAPLSAKGAGEEASEESDNRAATSAGAFTELLRRALARD
jgi:DNA-binding transcriptional MerR regulator